MANFENSEKKLDELKNKEAEAFYNLIMSTDQKWRKQWVDDHFKQQNHEGKAYKGNNQISLFEKSIDKNYDDPRWFTFNQIKQNGWSLKKGSKSSTIIFFGQSSRVPEKDKDGNFILDENGNRKYTTIHHDKPFFALHNVFNAKDIQGIEPFKFIALPVETQIKLKKDSYKDAQEMIDTFVKKHNIIFNELPSSRAFFRNGNDEKRIVVPLKSQFTNLDEYYATTFHELGHSTKLLGIRTNQPTDTPNGNTFGSKNYAREELTAELTSILLCKEFGFTGVENTEAQKNSLSYLKGWVENGTLTLDDFKNSLENAAKAKNAIFIEFNKLPIDQDMKLSREISLDINYQLLNSNFKNGPENEKFQIIHELSSITKNFSPLKADIKDKSDLKDTLFIQKIESYLDSQDKKDHLHLLQVNFDLHKIGNNFNKNHFLSLPIQKNELDKVTINLDNLNILNKEQLKFFSGDSSKKQESLKKHDSNKISL
ncbi:hypothetical protein A6A19_00230 [Actinobacillus delphinicola]|uniref:zincin-like metallopeptidase domain-containing protein n=1 Tax=Actinobacillus delphinicola TaxID=51161 RepID=UPI00244216B1|nr:zincin-like metallopeptidase domain-containing protein [Actinobacillus delphinicola]MDG6896472.1 hypothetical protein [Actinobacillus delphinicola]